MKLVSWNVNGWRAIVRKGSWSEAREKIKADVWCLQEIKSAEFDLPLETAVEFGGIWSCAEKKGYSGTAILVKKELLETEKVELWNNQRSAEEWAHYMLCF